MKKPPLFLSQLQLLNFATFENQTITFQPGFNSIVGETGSGKSLILDALQIALGGKADKKFIRTKAESAVVEVTFKFESKEIENFLITQDYPAQNNEIIIKRIIDQNGKSKSYLNFQNCTVSLISQFASMYIDVVGQFENQKLLMNDYQLKLVDHYGSHEDIVQHYKDKYQTLRKTESEFERIQSLAATRAQSLDFLNYQIQEIEKLNPSLEDEESLIKKKNIIMNLEKKSHLVSKLENLINGEQSLQTQLSSLKNILVKESSLFSISNIDQIIGLITQLEDEFPNLLNADFEEFTEEDINLVMTRLDDYQKIKKKHGPEIIDILNNLTKKIKERDELNAAEEKSQNFSDEIVVLKKELNKIASEIHSLRVKSAKKLAQTLTTTVQSLNMTGAQIDIRVSKTDELNKNGIDHLDFYAETNPGEGFFKVNQIASGGELSRILLSIRQVMSSENSVSIFLFDEVDSGIGGETALKIGKSLQTVAKSSQVITITHLPQIAIFSDNIVKVTKRTEKKGKEERTFSAIVHLTGQEAAKEVKSMTPLN